MSTQLNDALAAVDLFASLSRRQVNKLVDAGREVRCGAGKELATEGLGALAFHILLEGSVEVSRGDETLRTLGPGSYFGEISMIDGKPRSATVTTASEVTAFAIPHSAFASVVEQDGDLARALLLKLCGRLREAEARG